MSTSASNPDPSAGARADSLRPVARAVERMNDALQRRPSAGVHDDSPATARWEGATRVVASHANGTQMRSDMPPEMGGGGRDVTPGWLFRAGIASCSATVIALVAAERGIALHTLEVRCASRSDTCGMLGIAGADGRPVGAAAFDMRLQVRIGADGATPDMLRAVVAEGVRRSPAPNALIGAGRTLELEVEIDRPAEISAEPVAFRAAEHDLA